MVRESGLKTTTLTNIKPNIPNELKRTVEKLNLPSTLLLMGILLDHSLKLEGMRHMDDAKLKSVIEL